MPLPRAAILALCLLAGACSPRAKPGSPGAPSGTATPIPAVGADAGLEITTFISAAPARTLAAALAPYADQPLPISHALQDVWDAHGLRMVSLPIDDAPAILAKLQTGGGSQHQWLGQAYSWTEAARGESMGPGSVVALDAERIRLPAGVLRLLVRSWLEPAPPEPQVGAVSGGGSSANTLPGAILRVELVPQHQEAHPDESNANPLAINEPRIEAESRGMIFSRLYVRMSVPAGRALLILSERPSTDWKRIAAQPDPNGAAPAPATPAPKAASGADSETSWPKRPGESGGTPKPEPQIAPTNAKEPRPSPGAGPRLGQVVRGQIGPGDPPTPSTGDSLDSTQDSDPGPAASRVATFGEAMLSRSAPAIESRTPPPPQRTIVLLLPRVPREYRLLGPSAAPTPPPSPRREAPPSRE